MRLVVFDLDGTLLDSSAFISRNMVETFVAEGLPPPSVAASRNIIGLSLPEALQRLSSLDGPRLDALVERYRELYHGRINQQEMDEGLFDGADQIIRTLHAQTDTILGIATGKGMRGVTRVLDLHNLGPYFSTLQTPDHNPSKPHPAMLHSAMSETGAENERTLMIGDTSFDMEMAQAAGVKSIGVTWGSHSRAELRKAGANRVVANFGELLQAIDEITEKMPYA